MNRSSASFLQLQLGQEVIYLLLSLFALIALVLALFITSERALSDRLREEVSQGRDAMARVSTLEAKNSELQNALDKLNADTSEKVKINRRLAELESEREGARKAIAARDDELRRIQDELNRVRDELRRARAEIELIRNERIELDQMLSDKPPIINLSEAQGYTFASGDSALSDEFRARLGEAAIPRIVQEGARYQANVIEVIGHTDEVRVPERSSNLDSRLIAFLRGEGREGLLIVGDNTGLGMSRAASVVRYLMADPRLNGYSILPLSAGQTIEPGDRLSKGAGERDVRERRRIEIRLRRG